MRQFQRQAGTDDPKVQYPDGGAGVRREHWDERGGSLGAVQESFGEL